MKNVKILPLPFPFFGVPFLIPFPFPLPFAIAAKFNLVCDFVDNGVLRVLENVGVVEGIVLDCRGVIEG